MTYLTKAQSVRTAPGAEDVQPIDAHTSDPDELIGVVPAPPTVLTQPAVPPPAPAWLVAWMQSDDRRRALTMAAGKQRLAARLTRSPGDRP